MNINAILWLIATVIHAVNLGMAIKNENYSGAAGWFCAICGSVTLIITNL